MPIADTARESRVYTHSVCNGSTEVDGGEFRALADPLAGLERTYCSECQDFFHLSEFCWDDTGERITDYYARWSANASSMDLFWCQNGGLALLSGSGLAVGIGVGVYLGLSWGWIWGAVIAVVLGILGAIAGAVVREGFMSPRILRKVCGDDDTRKLV